MIDFHNMPSEAAGTLVTVLVRRDPSGDLSWDLDVAYQLGAEPVQADALEHALPGSSLLVEEGQTRTRKVTVNDSTEREDVKLSMVSVDTGEEVVISSVAEIRKVTLRVMNDVAATTIRYRIRGGAMEFASILQLLDARVSTTVDAVQVAIPFPSPKFPELHEGDLVSGIDFSGTMTCGRVVAVYPDHADVQEMFGLVAKVKRQGMVPPIKVRAEEGDVEGWVGRLSGRLKELHPEPVIGWGDVVQAIGLSYMGSEKRERGLNGEYILDYALIERLVSKPVDGASEQVN